MSVVVRRNERGTWCVYVDSRLISDHTTHTAARIAAQQLVATRPTVTSVFDELCAARATMTETEFLACDAAYAACCAVVHAAEDAVSSANSARDAAYKAYEAFDAFGERP